MCLQHRLQKSIPDVIPQPVWSWSSQLVFYRMNFYFWCNPLYLILLDLSLVIFTSKYLFELVDPIVLWYNAKSWSPAPTTKYCFFLLNVRVVQFPNRLVCCLQVICSYYGKTFIVFNAGSTYILNSVGAIAVLA